MLVLALLLGALLASAGPTCLDNPSTLTRAAHQSAWQLSYHFQHTIALSCGSTLGGGFPAYYTSYAINTTANYRIVTESDLVLEVREARCNGTLVACASSPVIGKVALQAGKQYVVLAGKSSSPLSSSASLVVTQCASDCTAEGEEEEPEDTHNYGNAYEFIYELMIAFPLALFGAALLLSIVLCVRGGKPLPDEQPAMVSVRKLAISVSFLSVAVMATDWIVFFSAFVYPFTLATLVIGVMAYRAAGPRFAESKVARNRSLVGGILLVSAVVVVCGLGVGIVQVVALFPIYLLLTIFLPLLAVYALGVLLAMLVLGIVLLRLRAELARAGLNSNDGGVTIGGAPIPVATVCQVDHKGDHEDHKDGLVVVVATPDDVESNYRG